MEALLAVFGIVTLALAMAITNVWGGFVLTKLWLWFVVPVFHLPVLTLPPAIGLCLVGSYLSYQYVYIEDNRSSADKFATATAHGLIYPAIILLIGWVVQMFM